MGRKAKGDDGVGNNSFEDVAVGGACASDDAIGKQKNCAQVETMTPAAAAAVVETTTAPEVHKRSRDVSHVCGAHGDEGDDKENLQRTKNRR